MSIDMPVLKAVREGKAWAYCVWEPVSPIVVTGRGGTIEREVKLEACRADGVGVYQRRTGGGTVVLSPGVLVFSLGRIVEKKLAIKEYQQAVNVLITEFLESLGVTRLTQKGISDLCIDDKKILGSGMYMGKNVLFFQGSLLVNPDLSLIEKYLPHPPREPDYRKGRSHLDFVTSIEREGFQLEASALIKPLYEYMEKNITRLQ